MKIFLSHGADPNAQNSAKATALHYSASKGHDTVMREILKLGEEAVDVEKKDASGATALHRAAARGKLDCVKLLLASGASVVA